MSPIIFLFLINFDSKEAELIYWTINPIPEEELLFHDLDLIAAAASLREDTIDDIAYFAQNLHARPTKPPIRTYVERSWTCSNVELLLYIE